MRRRDHVVLTFDQLGEALGLDGEVLRVWFEHESDYLHVLLNGGTGSVECPSGGYVESREWPGRDRQVMADGTEIWIGDDGRTRVIK